MFRKVLVSFIVLCMVATSLVGCNSKQNTTVVTPGQATPRNETLYMKAGIWSAPANFNPLAPNPCAMPIAASAGLTREPMYETLFMFNQLDNSMSPLLATKSEWTDKYTLTVTLNPDAHWNDSKPVTADDVVYTYELGKKYTVNWSNYWTYIDSVTAKDAHTIVINCSQKNYNKLLVMESLDSMYILPKHIWSAIETNDNNDPAKILAEFNKNPVSSGPYKLFFYNDTKVTLIRDDNYWGKAASMFGKLPAPKYITENIYKDNSASDTAFKQGEIDVSQSFTPNIWTFWQNDKLPIKTYLPDKPYFIPGSIPQLIFNIHTTGLDNASVRKAIAMCIDYDKISTTAMSGYSAKIVPSLMLPTNNEQSLIDSDHRRLFGQTMSKPANLI